MGASYAAGVSAASDDVWTAEEGGTKTSGSGLVDKFFDNCRISSRFAGRAQWDFDPF